MPEQHTPSQPPSDTDPTAASWLIYRLNTDPNFSAHGYEIGYWPAGVDRSDPRNFAVVERAFGQVEAAARTVALNIEGAQKIHGGPQAEHHANAIGEEHEEGVHRGSRRR